MAIASHPLLADQIRDQHWREDLEEIRLKLPKSHKNLFRSFPESKFQTEISALEKAVPQLSDAEIIVAIMELIASCGDAHTEVDESTTGFHGYPLTLQWFPDGIRVVATAREHSEILGTRLVQVEKIPIAKVMEMVVSVFPRENMQQVQTELPEFLANAEVLHTRKIVPQMKSAAFVFEESSGKRLTARLSPLQNNARVSWETVPAKALRQKHSDRYYWFEYLSDSRTLYFQYSRCANMKRLSFSDFNEKLMRFIDSHPIDKLIVDLRSNQGGDSSVIDPFVDSIRENPSINQKGHLFVVVGPATFSSGVMAAFALKDNTNAIFVGGPTGGRPNFFGEVKDFELPHSHLRIRYSTNFFRLSKWEDQTALFPDIRTQMSWTDYVTGNDPSINAILHYK